MRASPPRELRSPPGRVSAHRRKTQPSPGTVRRVRALVRAREEIAAPAADPAYLRLARRGVGALRRGVGALRLRARLGVLLTEPLHAAGRVQQLLFAGVERMAAGADLDVDLGLRGA